MSAADLRNDPVARRAQARVGRTLRDKWHIDRLLGMGGMAAVYAATHRNGKRGAIKLLHLELSQDEGARRRFLQEGYAANRVGHPGVVSVLDDDVDDDGSVFLVMELLDGMSVDSFASRQPQGRVGLPATLHIADQVLDVLAAAHEKGIIHRDLKPENFFLTRDGAVKVLDFGIARIRELQSAAARATRTGEAMGTPAFMPPEQALGNWHEVDARTDLWALGASMFTMLTGRLVHEAATLNQTLLAAMTKPAPPIRSILPDVPPAVAAVIDRALAFQRDRRWPDARAMQQALRGAGAGVVGSANRSFELDLSRALTAVPEATAPSSSMLVATLKREDDTTRPRGSRLPLLIAGAAIAAVAALLLVVRPWAGPPAADDPASGATPEPTQAAAATSSAAIDVAPSRVEPSAAAPTAAPSGSAAPPKPSAAPSAAAPMKAVPATSAKKPAAPPTADPFGSWRPR